MMSLTSQSLTVSSSSSPCSVLLSFSQKNKSNLVRYRKKQQHSKFICFLNLGLDDVAQVAHNKVLIAASLSAAIGQLSKPFTSVLFYGRRNFDFKSALQSGGFPSSHSSSVVATATSLALERGFSDSTFGLAVVYAALVMYDSRGVRREVGNHARALNKVIPPNTKINSIGSKDRNGFVDSSSKKSSNSPQLIVITEQRVNQSSSEDGPLKESIGHTEVEVAGGAFLGFLVSLAVHAVL